jgi:hypothetical protein
MKKIIVSAAVAAMALSTSAFALEDVKTTGQMKVYYETNNAGDNSVFSKESSSAEVVFKVGFTGKQGDVGFGATIYQASTMGLEGKIVNGVRTGSQTNGAPFIGEAYITAPIAPSTTLKFGKQEIDSPLAFTERWNAIPNTFNAALAINSSIDNVTLIAGYVGQGTTGTGSNTGFTDGVFGASQYFGGATTIAALYANDGLAVNFWAYHIENVGAATPTLGGVSVNAAWVDGSVKVGPATVKAYAALVSNDGDNSKDTSAFALSGAGKVGGVTLFAAASMVSSGDLPVANTATGFKKTKLPTAAVYLDGKYVGQPETMAFKIKAAGKLGTTGLALQAVMNDGTASNDANENLDAQEIDLIISQKVGVFNLKGILMNRSWSEDGHDAQQHVRVIASVNF